MKICLKENPPGKGGIAGGAGNLGQTSQIAEGHFATGYGYPVIDIATGMTASFTVQLTTDWQGQRPSDLSDIQTIYFVARPCMQAQTNYIKVPCTKVLDEDSQPTGEVTFTLTPAEVNNRQGVHFAQVLCYTADDALTKDYRCYLQIRKGMTGAQQNGNFPVTIAEIRLAIMDTSAQANTLLDDLQFSDMMIAQCVQRAVAEFNETPPSLANDFTAASFPYRNALITGAVGYLMDMVMYRYTRNRMQHSNAGLAFDDSDKQQVYLSLAQRAKHEWKAFVMSKKTQLNMHECFSVMAQPWYESGDLEIYW